MKTIQTILNLIDNGNYSLPEFQRGYVWNRDQVKKLMNSLYHEYPIGSLLVWVTPSDDDLTRGNAQLAPGAINMILDGQQRITSLYGIIRGKPPEFFQGNTNAFTNLYFDLDEEKFEFYAPLKMKDNSNWINVTDLMQKGAGHYIGEVIKSGEQFDNSMINTIIERLNKLDRIKNTDLHIHEVVGEDKTIDVVVEIFNNVNSGGTKLSKGDLALATICSKWTNARNEMRNILEKFETSLYSFNLDWLLRCVTVYLTGKAYFSELADVPISDFKSALYEVAKLIEKILNHIASRLGLDHDRVLGSRYSIPTMVRYLKINGGDLSTNEEWNKLMFWYIHTFLWGRYSSATESVLAQDLNIIESGEGIDGLISILQQNRGDLTVRAADFTSWSTSARFYPLLYLLTRVNHAKDWDTGIELSNALLGRFSTLEVHHIFPKSLLYAHGYTKSQVNALGNYAFLTKETNLKITNRYPIEYVPELSSRHPGVIESHWMPIEKEFLEVDNYLQFLEKRKEILAESTNEFLQSLVSDTDNKVEIQNFANREVSYTEQHDDDTLHDIRKWMLDFELLQGEINYPLIDNENNELMIIDLAWPEGIQAGLSEPIALLINESIENQKLVIQNGFKPFTDIEKFKTYIESNYVTI
ncbi:MAG: DUF262 domain-containing protein [Oscillospiraceae bacterium]|nr:DUF262 domain-containing protein [Oscillospiraceae bacterium]